MHQLAPAGFTETCSVTPVSSSPKAAICQVAENAGCPHAVFLKKTTLCMHPQSHLFMRQEFEQDTPVRTKSIMIVDHDLDLMHRMASVLRNAGYEVMESDDGDLSLKVLEEWNHLHIDLVITDTKMQGILRQTFLDLRPNTRILFVSQKDPRQLLLQDGAPFLPKPFTAPALLRQVIALIGKV